MPEETATLADASVTPSTKPEESAPSPEAAPPVAAPPPDAEALEMGGLLKQAGYNKAQINQIIESPRALEALRHMIISNPKEFLTAIERNNPQAFEKMIETGAETYVERHAPKSAPTPGKAQDSELMAQVESLRRELTEVRTEQQRRDAAVAMAGVKSRYDAYVDEQLSKLPKELKLTKAETKGLRAQLDQELAQDLQMVGRINAGNFWGVSEKFKGIVQDWSNDRKAAADAEKSARDRSSRSALPDLSTGPNPALIDLPKDFADSWENTEEAFAKALERS